jgi:aryl-alcohol dehydrogenase-like predicted oxidoreductase
MTPFVSLQPLYNALNRSIEAELLPLCAEQGIGVMSYNPLAGGMLTGKYRRNEPLPRGSRLEAFSFYHDRYYTDQALEIVGGFLQEASRRSVSPAQLALAWVLAEPRISSPILGARSIDQIKDSLKGAEIHLTAEERAAIPAVQAAHWVGEDPVYGT